MATPIAPLTKEELELNYADINGLVMAFQSARENLMRVVRETFPLHTPVFVKCSRYVGEGIVSPDFTYPDKVPVLLENGNVWCYDADHVRRLEGPFTSWPQWLRQRIIQIKLIEGVRRPGESRKLPVYRHLRGPRGLLP